MLDIGNWVNKPIIIEPTETYAAIVALDDLITHVSTTTAFRLTLDIASLREELPEVIYFSTASFWGIWKNLTRKEIVWTLNRSQAIRLRAALLYRIEKKIKTPLSVNENWFRYAPMF